MGIRERKQRDYENRKKLILQTAKKLYSQKGFFNVTLDDIAAEIEISKGTIYAHFESKEEIHAQVLLEQLESLQQHLKAAADLSDNLEQGIRRCLEVYLGFYHEHREYSQLLFFVDIFSHQYRIPQKLLKEIKFQKIACLTQLQRVIKKGIDSRELENRLPSKNVAFVLWGMLNGILQLAESRQIDAAKLDSLITVGFQIVMKGLNIKNKKQEKIHGSL